MTGRAAADTSEHGILGRRRPAGIVNRELALRFALRSNDGVEGDI